MCPLTVLPLGLFTIFRRLTVGLKLLCDHYPSVFHAIIIYVIEFPGGKIKLKVGGFFCVFCFVLFLFSFSPPATVFSPTTILLLEVVFFDSAMYYEAYPLGVFVITPG